MKEKLIITCEIEDVPAGTYPMSFEVCFVKKGRLDRIMSSFGWKRVTYRRAVVTNLETTS